MRRVAGVAAAAVSAVLCLAAALAPSRADTLRDRFDGEHGLWVEQSADSLIVRWLTQEPARGQLRVSGPGGEIGRFETAEAQAHRVALAKPAEAELILAYGVANLALEHQFETRISLAPPVRRPVEFAAPDSLYIVADTHGEFTALLAGLRIAGLIDGQMRWKGGRRHLVVAGDMMDRGPDVVQLLWFVYRLEREAEAAGGRVHVVLGNHEVMVLLGDLRYVHPKDRQVADLHGVPYDSMYDVRHSLLGRWLASKPAAVRAGRVLIAHGGVDARYAQASVQAIDDTLAAYVGEELFYRWTDTTATINIDSASYQRRDDFFWGADSPFWHRSYVQAPDSTAGQLQDVLRRLDADLLVVGHTPVRGIQVLHEGRLIAAHTPLHGAELLLLVRDDDRLRRFRVGTRGTEEIP